MYPLQEFEYKKFGFMEFGLEEAEKANKPLFNEFIKILFLTKGSVLDLEFNHYELARDTVFFIGPGQWFRVKDPMSAGILLSYNRDFYCIEIHDKEVACDGILYHNVFEVPFVELDSAQSGLYGKIFEEMKEELAEKDFVMEEMLRVLLKQIIIRSTRMWKKGKEGLAGQDAAEVDIIRKFSQLIDRYFKTKHAVADYAEMLNMTPKALSKRIAQVSSVTPNDLIKERILLEAKRLLAHTEMTVKEVGYALGYEDPAYFVRFFTNSAECSPLDFRKKFHRF
ncbi:MAG: helix-turn-helix domain-containing protein [Bacteroidetes bacterium]|nr:helix-turn-helix domain-containing protein [Bacteroidota bacterium]